MLLLWSGSVDCQTASDLDLARCSFCQSWAVNEIGLGSSMLDGEIFGMGLKEIILKSIQV